MNRSEKTTAKLWKYHNLINKGADILEASNGTRIKAGIPKSKEIKKAVAVVRNTAEKDYSDKEIRATYILQEELSQEYRNMFVHAGTNVRKAGRKIRDKAIGWAENHPKKKEYETEQETREKLEKEKAEKEAKKEAKEKEKTEKRAEKKAATAEKDANKKAGKNAVAKEEDDSLTL